MRSIAGQGKITDRLRKFFPWLAAFALIAAGTPSEAQISRTRVSDRFAKVGAVTLLPSGDQVGAVFGALIDNESSVHALSTAPFQRQIFESAIPRYYSSPITASAGYTNSVASGATSMFPTYAPSEESAWTQEITPVSEPGTWIAGACAMGFLIWRGRKRLMARIVGGHFFRRPGRCSQLTKLCRLPVKMPQAVSVARQPV
jgi:hypothetical protein